MCLARDLCTSKPHYLTHQWHVIIKIVVFFFWDKLYTFQCKVAGLTSAFTVVPITMITNQCVQKVHRGWDSPLNNMVLSGTSKSSLLRRDHDVTNRMNWRELDFNKQNKYTWLHITWLHVVTWLYEFMFISLELTFYNNTVNLYVWELVCADKVHELILGAILRLVGRGRHLYLVFIVHATPSSEVRLLCYM